MKKKIYPWLICLMSTLLISCCMGLTNGTFSVFQPYLVKSGLTNTQASMILTARNIFSCIAIALITQYYGRMKMRRGMVVNLCIGALAFLIYSRASSYLMYLLAAAVSGFCYGWGGILPASILIRRWFRKNKTLALGISGSGTGVAMLILPMILTAVIESQGMKAAFHMNMALMLVTALLIFLIVKESPEEAGMLPWGGDTEEKEKEKKAAEGHGLTRVEFAMMAASMLLLGVSTQPEVNHIAVYYAELGFPVHVAPMTISLIGATLIAGKCIYGYLADRFEPFYINLIYYLGIVAGLVCFALCSLGTMIPAYIGGVCMGFGTTLATVGMMAMAGDLETSEKYMKAGKYYQLFYMGAVLVFNTVPGLVADLTGSYRPVYFLAPVLMAAGMLLTQTVYIRHGSLKHEKNA